MQFSLSSRPLSLLLAGSFALIAAACGGGGGGGGGANNLGAGNVGCNPGDYRPTPPSGLGVAGVMNGHWRVVAQELVADPRLRNPDLDDAWLAMDEEIEFRDGLVYFGEEPGNEPGPQPNEPQVEVIPEFLCNEQAAGLTLYGYGVRWTSVSLGSGAVRLCGIFGTTSATRAIGVLVEEVIFTVNGVPPVDNFTVYQVTLEKFTPLPAMLGANDPGAASVASTSGSPVFGLEPMSARQ